MKVWETMKAEFSKSFGREDGIAYFAPGRVNLIGEHTDYNGGHVFPCAISLGTYALAAPRQDKKIQLFSLNLAEKGVSVLTAGEELEYEAARGWANYPAGVIKLLQESAGAFAQGADILFYGTLPNGAGLSSSASLEVLTAVIFDDLLQLGKDRIELIRLSQKAENQFVGVNCGIMDQFAVGMGKKDCAILLDCNTLDYRYSKIKLDGYSIVMANTNKEHSLGSSKYNERRSQCEAALADLQKVRAIQALGELSCEEFEALASHITNPVNRQRAKHAVYENQRTLKAVKALEENDLVLFGRLMNESHISLRDDYEVTGMELDTLAELAWEQPGVLGSRMTGGGFGGCTVSLVRTADIPEFEEKIGRAYTEKIGYAPSFYVANIADGAGRI